MARRCHERQDRPHGPVAGDRASQEGTVRPPELQCEAAGAGEAQADADHVHVEPVGPMQGEVPAYSELAAEAAGGPAHEGAAVKARRLV